MVVDEKRIRIYLTVREGKNFVSSAGTYFLEATLNGHKTTSEPIFTEQSWPLFNTEFMWKLDRREFTYLRENNRPLRVECFTVEGWRKKRVGFVLLQLQQASYPGAGNGRQSPEEEAYRWVRLFGLDTGYRLLQPELAVRMHVTGRGKHHADSPHMSLPASRKIFTCKQTESVLCLESDAGDTSWGAGGVQRRRGRQHGMAPGDMYVVSFLVQAAFNLELLAQGVGSGGSPGSTQYSGGTFARSRSSREPYNLTLTFLDLTVNTKYFPKARNQVVLNDKIVFKFRSSRDYLLAFFDKYNEAQLCFWQGRVLLGTSQIDLTDFNIRKFFSEGTMLKSKYQRDLELRVPETGRVPRSKNGKTPFVTIVTYLHRTGVGVAGPAASGGRGEPQHYRVSHPKSKNPAKQPPASTHRAKARSVAFNLKHIARRAVVR